MARAKRQKKSCRLTEAEWRIMKAVWQEEPCAAPTEQEALESETGWSYSTVKTMMDRMVEKALLTTERIRNLILYRSAITQEQAREGELRRTLRNAFDGALSPMMHFLLDSGELSERELTTLETLIKEKRKGRNRSR